MARNSVVKNSQMSPMADIDGTNVSLSLRIQFKTDPAASWTSNNPVLLLGEIGIETDTRKFKFGDGLSTWTELQYAGISVEELQNQIDASKAKVFMAAKTSVNDDDATAIENAFAEGGQFHGFTPKEGDTFILTATIGSQEVQTPYIYQTRVSGSAGWIAMAGKFDATRVVLKDDITLAGDYTSIGNVKLSEGKITADGMTVADLLTKIFTKELQPQIETHPAATVNLLVDGSNAAASYEAGTTLSLSFSGGKLSSTGSYTYKSSASQETITPVDGTGVTATGYSCSHTGSSIDLSSQNGTSGTIGEVQLTDSGYTFKFNVQHSAGYFALTNLNKLSSPVIQIAAGTKTATKAISAYRNIFIGYDTTAGNVVTAEQIRALAQKRASNNGNKVYNIAEDTTKARIIVAMPATMSGISKVIMPSSANADVTSSFVAIENVSVPGAESYSPIAYKVYVYAPAKMGGTYQITLK